jgi:hypothetical protein
VVDTVVAVVAVAVVRDAVTTVGVVISSVEVAEASACRCAEGGTGESAEASGTGTKALLLA